jgi:hypothetical protein
VCVLDWLQQGGALLAKRCHAAQMWCTCRGMIVSRCIAEWRCVGAAAVQLLLLRPVLVRHDARYDVSVACVGLAHRHAFECFRPCPFEVCLVLAG